MKISSSWATPLTMGAFAVMATTGLLMFFHADIGLNKTAHEWLGWVMVAGVALHAVANWRLFKKYFVTGTASRAILATSAAVLLASFLSPGDGGPGAGLPPHVQALKATTVASAQANLDSVVVGNRELEGKAIGVLFAR
jgi:hypothetical protein